MDLTQLANLGEFIGGIGSAVGALAVFVTLIYLAVQVRQNTALARAAAQREINGSFQNAIGQLRQERWIYQRGCLDFDEMSHADQLCFDLSIAPIVNHLDQVLRMHQQGLESLDNVDAYGTICLAILQAPGARSWWERAKPYFVKETREYLEQRFSDPSTLPPAFLEALPWHGPDPEDQESDRP